MYVVPTVHTSAAVITDAYACLYLFHRHHRCLLASQDPDVQHPALTN